MAVFLRHMRAACVAVALLLVISLLMLPFWADILIWMVLLLVLRWSMAQVSAFCIMLVVALCAANLLSPYIITADVQKRVLYREYEKYRTRTNNYRPNVRDTLTIKHGDLYVIDAGTNLAREQIPEYREQVFITDKYGFRNDRFSVEDADIMLIGDSYVTGSTTTQAEMPSNVLADMTGKRVANMSYPAGPTVYKYEYVPKYLKEIKGTGKILVFYFEGNDFITSKKLYKQPAEKPQPALDLLKGIGRIQDYKSAFLSLIYGENNLLYKKVRGASLALNKLMFFDGINVYHQIGSKMVGFLSTYNQAALSENARASIITDKALLSRINAVVFIPTKFRVYAQMIGQPVPNPPPTLAYLKREYNKRNVPVIDLTPALQKYAKELLAKGEYVYWRDDSHWNGNGIRAGMRCIKRWLSLPAAKQGNYSCP